MKGVMLDVPEFVLEWRRKTGADRFDEVWNGVLHMVPAANIGHQQFERALLVWLSLNWMHSGREVLHQVNVSADDDWVNNFRVPDIVLLLPEETGFLRENFVQGAPSVVIEIRSPDDETYEKFPFYAALGAKEIWVIDRDTRMPELFRLAGDTYEQETDSGKEWLSSKAVGIELRQESDGRLGIRLAGDDASYARLPG